MDAWLSTLNTATPREGFELAKSLSQKEVRYIQPSPEMGKIIHPARHLKCQQFDGCFAGCCY